MKDLIVITCNDSIEEIIPALDNEVEQRKKAQIYLFNNQNHVVRLWRWDESSSTWGQTWHIKVVEHIEFSDGYKLENK